MRKKQRRVNKWRRGKDRERIIRKPYGNRNGLEEEIGGKEIVWGKHATKTIAKRTSQNKSEIRG